MGGRGKTLPRMIPAMYEREIPTNGMAGIVHYLESDSCYAAATSIAALFSANCPAMYASTAPIVNRTKLRTNGRSLSISDNLPAIQPNGTDTVMIPTDR